MALSAEDGFTFTQDVNWAHKMSFSCTGWQVWNVIFQNYMTNIIFVIFKYEYVFLYVSVQSTF